MSFSVSFKSPPADVSTTLESHSAPEPVKEFLRLAASALSKHEMVSVSAYGHLHDGTPGNYEPSSCTIEVKPA
jgi:hypothetical protein